MTVLTLSDQVSRLVAENQNLRVRTEADQKTIHLMQERYDALAAQVDDIRDRAARDVAEARDYAEREVSHITIERDQALSKHEIVDGLLMQVADLVLQASRASTGSEQVAPIVNGADDARLPRVGMN